MKRLSFERLEDRLCLSSTFNLAVWKAQMARIHAMSSASNPLPPGQVFSVPPGSTITTPPSPTPSPAPAPTVTAKPHGYQTFYAAGKDANSSIPSTQAYYRFDWGAIEIAPGKYVWDAMDAAYDAAKLAGQRFNFRIMPYADDAVAGVTGLKSLPGTQFHYNGNLCWQPNLDSPAVQTDLDKFLAALGARYGANTATVDVGFYGASGEWSAYGVDVAPPLPSVQTWQWLIAEHKKYFPGSIIVTQACVGYEYSNEAYLNSAMNAGCWQRFDSWGLSDAWDSTADAAALAVMKANPNWLNICTIGEPWSESSWALTDWQKAVAFAQDARMAMWSTKGSLILPAAMPLVNQLLAFEAAL